MAPKFEFSDSFSGVAAMVDAAIEVEREALERLTLPDAIMTYGTALGFMIGEIPASAREDMMKAVIAVIRDTVGAIETIK